MDCSVVKKVRYHVSRIIASFLPDKLYLSIKFRTRFGYWMDWNHPKTFSEKLQWLKVFDRHEEYTLLVDKVAVKPFVAGIIGWEYVIPTLATYRSVDEIDFDKLPNKFVLKCNHDSGGLVVCKNKKDLDLIAAKKKLRKGLKHTYITQNREYPYAKVPRQIIAEPFIVDESGYELKDYKFFCFDGQPKFLFVATGRLENDVKFDFFDMDWNHIPVKNGHPNSLKPIRKPEGFEKMVEIAKKLSMGFRHVRVDLYNVNGKVYFGELTFFHFSGMTPFVPSSWDEKFGKLLHLPTDGV